MVKNGWGVCGVVLGTWEAAAILTGRVPTVSLAVARARHRYPTLADALVLAWAVGTARHLLTYQP